MPQDQAALAAAQAQIDANPELQAYLKSIRGGRGGAGATNPAQFGIQAPSGYVISNATGKLVDNWSLSDKVMTAIAAGGATGGLLSGLGAAAPAVTSASGTSVPAAEGGAAIVGNIAPWTAAGGSAASAIPAAAAPVGAALGGMTANAPAASSIGSQLKNAFTDPGNLASLAAIIPALAGGFGGGGNNAGGVDTGRLDQLLGMAADRAQRTDPLHQMVTRLAESRMPISSRKG
jgi:hypothetical protein